MTAQSVWCGRLTGLTRTFTATCRSTSLSWALVLAEASPFVQEEKEFGEGRELGSRRDTRAEGQLPPGLIAVIT